MNTHPHITVSTSDPDWMHENDPDPDIERSVAERTAQHICSSTNLLMSYIASEDCSDLFDGSIRLRLHSQSIPVADAALLASVLPPDERDVILSDVREAMRAWIVARELEG